MIAVILLVVLAIVLVIVRAQSDKKQNKEAEDQSQKATGETWMGAFEAYDVAFNIIKKNPLFVLAMTALTAIGYLIDRAAFEQYGTGHFHMSYGFVFALPLSLVLPAFSLAAVDKRAVNLASLYRRPLRIFGSLILTVILIELIAISSALLFIVPVIWGIGWFMLAIFVVMDKNAGPIKALKESKRLAKDHVSKVWGIIGVSVLLSFAANIIAIIPVAGKYISMAIAGAATVWINTAAAVLYRWLQKNVKV